jgi:hypothetical protein
MQESYAKTQEIVDSRECPLCKGPLRYNSAIAGWWQCAQFGAPQFRMDKDRPACSWQGMTDPDKVYGTGR